MIDRARGALIGLALGDALGMPTQGLSRAAIATSYGDVTGLMDARDDQPIAPGMTAGMVTDDTEQALLVAGLLVEGAGRVNPAAFSDALVAWEAEMTARGSRDLLGPSTKAAVRAIAAGADPAAAGSGGTTNGAAMRITPVAIAHPAEPVDALWASVRELSFITHNSSIALAGAAAVAGTVAAGIEGADFDQALEHGLRLAELAEASSPWAAGATIVGKACWSLETARRLDDAGLADFVHDAVGTSVQAQESVVAALVLADRFRDRPYAGLCLAAGLGGDTDTVAAIVGAMLGAVGGDCFPAGPVARVVEVSGLNLEPVIADLLELRATASHQRQERP